VPNLGLSELIVIFMIVLLVFGGSRLPAIGEAVGKTIRGFKRGAGDDEPASSGNASLGDRSSTSSAASSTKRDATDADLVDKT
jgi:sec-independent protein translocase protein TatA